METPKEAAERIQEEKAQVEIFEKNPDGSRGRTVDHFEEYYDEALRAAKAAIAGKEGKLGYQIVKPF